MKVYVEGYSKKKENDYPEELKPIYLNIMIKEFIFKNTQGISEGLTKRVCKAIDDIDFSVYIKYLDSEYSDNVKYLLSKEICLNLIRESALTKELKNGMCDYIKSIL